MRDNNYCVIMSGGVGSRFWPVSREEMPKQFLDFFGTGRSLLQTTFDRLTSIIPVENIFIVTNDSYSDITKKQLPELSDTQILLEPIRRNTAPAIAYASFHIYAKNPKANIVVAPSDHLILKKDIFLQEIERGLDFVESNPCLLTLGIKPSRPETGYGYIQESNEEIDGIKKVKTFTEKPNIDLAKVFYESGEFVWNSGIFLWNVQTIIDSFKLHLPDIYNKMLEGKDKFNTPNEKLFIDEAFPFCPNISIDYGILEKADNVYVIGCDFGWSDLGTWGSLYEVSDRDDNDNVSFNSKTLFFDSNENIVTMSDDNKLVVIQGLEGYIVAESDNTLLICKKEEEQRIKHFVTEVKFKYGDDFV